MAKKKTQGWLDAYDDELQLGGYVYPVNYVPQAENGIEGTMGGLTDKGFDYNGAWGGPSMQFGGVLNFLEPTSKKLPEGYNPKAKGSSTEYATSIGGEDGEPAYLIPSFKYGKLLDDPVTEFRRTGEHLGGPFKTWQEADEWERTVRHPYVEKGQNIPTPFRRWGKDFAMGGSLPGSVGFTYARTKGIPSNGPYAKKTMASAQNGMEMKFYQEGLDWKPRNISRDGSEIPQAQLGTHMLTPDYSQVGENIMEMLSVPQKALTKLFSGKYQTPSEAMNIKNPVGAFAVDAILDPVNLMGAGAIGKAAKEAIAFKPKPGMMYRGLGEEGFKDAVESGVLRPKQHGYSEGRSLAEKVTTPKQFGSTFYAPAEKFGIVKNYGAKYVAEVPFDEATFARRYGRKDWSWSTGRQIPIDESRILKKDWLRGYKEVKPKKKEKGGEIKKDDNGYWNPDNWGKPVEIGSNEITMEGVYEPLLGISDTGDTQMMYPGEDYTFDGESVTEYPVAQKGITIPAPTRADSIMLLKNSILKNAFYKNNPNYFNINSPLDLKDPKVLQNLAKSSESTKHIYRHNKDSDIIGESNPYNPKQFIITAGDIKRRTGKVSGSSNVYSAPDIVDGTGIDLYFNPASPPIFFSPSILPQGTVTYGSTKLSKHADISKSPYYDPLAVTPWDMLTPQQQKLRLKQYGTIGTPYDNSPKPKPKQKTTKSQPKVETKPERETKKDPVVPISKMETPTALNKTVPNLPYRVDYSGKSQYFASDKEGEEFMRKLNKDFQENKIPNPGNVSGYYETKKKKNGGWLEKYN